MNKILKIILISVILLSTFNYAFAAISVEPPLIEISSQAGEVVSGELMVHNYSNQDLKIKAETEYFFKPPKLNDKDLDLNSWLRVEPKDFMLKASEVKKVNYLIKLPKGFRGETLAQVYFSSDDDLNEKDKVTVKARFGVGLYVAAKNTEILRARISKIDVLSKDNEINYVVEVENLGNVHLRPKGEIIVQDFKGVEIQRLNTQYGWPVFPKCKYTYDTKWQNVNFTEGKYRAKAIIEYTNPYNQTIVKRLSGQIVFTISKDGRVEIVKVKEEKDAI